MAHSAAERDGSAGGDGGVDAGSQGGGSLSGILGPRELRAASRTHDATALTFLSVSGRELTDVEALRPCERLRRLDLSSNKLAAPPTFLVNLVQLDCSFNAIETAGLRAVGQLKALEDLNLAGNRLTDTERCSGYIALLPQLKTLRLREEIGPDADPALENPLCFEDSYPMALLDALPGLHTLDGLPAQAPGTVVALRGVRRDGRPGGAAVTPDAILRRALVSLERDPPEPVLASVGAGGSPEWLTGLGRNFDPAADRLERGVKHLERLGAALARDVADVSKAVGGVVPTGGGLAGGGVGEG